ncbi:unnamed protein product [Nezara viridula]|uniref:Hyaluronan/mRNA-binding protein domain-containing protein n=1 Tax=Nezara viridula TaxID=85310 RepID=A0A9P0HFK3_NEZVI|nr:unnamed protein product [Nezara viridula]
MAPNQYAIGVAKNKFALCDSEEELDPHELLKKQEKQKEEKKKAKVVEKNTSKPVKNAKSSGQVSKASSNFKQGQDARSQNDGGRPRALPPAAKRNVNFNERNQSVPKQDRDESSIAERDRNADYKADGSSGSESGAPDRVKGERRGFSRVFVRGGGRGGRGGFDNGRKREFDRRSGSDKTGVKPVDKRRASGSFNWGNPGDEVFDVKVPQEEPKSPEGSQTVEQSDKVETNEAGKEEEAQVVSTETQALTLDEWKALKSSRPKPSYNIRKPGEGEDLTRWKDMIVLSKKATDEEEDEELEYGEYPQRVGRQKRLEIDVRFYDRRGRGGRGRGAARGPPNGPLNAPHGSDQHRSDQHRSTPAPAPRVDDEADFPSLLKAK